MTKTSNAVRSDKITTVQPFQAGWRQFIRRLMAEPTDIIGHEIEQHLEHHLYDVSPEIRIELECRWIRRH